MRIFLRNIKSKPYRVVYIMAGSPASKDKDNEKIGVYEPKAEGKPEKVELDINKYDALITSGATATKPVDKLRMAISPPPPAKPEEVSESATVEEEASV